MSHDEEINKKGENYRICNGSFTFSKLFLFLEVQGQMAYLEDVKCLSCLMHKECKEISCN